MVASAPTSLLSKRWCSGESLLVSALDRVMADRPPCFGVVDLALFQHRFVDEVQLTIAGKSLPREIATANATNNYVGDSRCNQCAWNSPGTSKRHGVEGHPHSNDPIDILSLLNILLAHTVIFLSKSLTRNAGYMCPNIFMAHDRVCCASPRLRVSS
jgi:hypothetical protein